VVTRDLTEKPATVAEKPTEVSFADAWMLQRDFSTGPMEMTGNVLDFALDGEGFFTVQTAAGQAYTRDGRFSLNDQGEVVTRNGERVMGEGGPIQINQTGGPLSAARDGSISQDNQIIGKLRVSNFATPAALEKVGNNLWRATDEQPTTAANARVSSGFVEGSNVNAVKELTEMIEISRAYTSVAKMVQQSDELRGQSIEKLARVR